MNIFWGKRNSATIATKIQHGEPEATQVDLSLCLSLLLLLLTALPLSKEGLGHCPKQDDGPGTKPWQVPITASTMALEDKHSNQLMAHIPLRSTKHTPLSANVLASSLLASAVIPPLAPEHLIKVAYTTRGLFLTAAGHLPCLLQLQ